jgi:hypothetical protein
MPMTRNQELTERLRGFVENGVTGGLATVCEEIDSYIFDGGEFPHTLLDGVLKVIESEHFLNLSDSVAVIKIFEYNLDLLKDYQRDHLVRTLTYVIPNSRDSVAGFLAVELISEVWKDHRSLDVLLALARDSTSENTIALVAHGFDWLYRKTSSQKVKGQCIDELTSLAKRSFPLVIDPTPL